MFAATRVMAAGKAGLESLPFFVDELMGQGIRQLAPWAADHSQEQIDQLNNAVRENLRNDWRYPQLHGIGDEDTKIGIRLSTNTPEAFRLLRRINPPASTSPQLADHPAMLAAWCRINLWQYCQDTFDMWQRFKFENGIGNDQQLAVVIPYCPEGPTSGTVGMYLGAALRKWFNDRRNPHDPNELVVWGIELCPPINADATGTLDNIASRSVFRGFIARQELLQEQGLPLTHDSADSGTTKPFDINIAFDGGTSKAPFDDIADIHPALDRAAAQATACLLNGANAGDVPEGTNALIEGGRWNAYLAHVVSQRAYDPGCRYFNYYVRLPWHRNEEGWRGANTRRRKQSFRDCIEREIRPLLESEKDLAVKERVESLVDLSTQAQEIKRDGPIVSIFTGNQKRVQAILEQAEQQSHDHADQLNRPGTYNTPENAFARPEPFCLNIILPKGMRLRTAELSHSDGRQPVISELLGDAMTSSVRDQLKDLCTQVLQRSDCSGPDSDSQALFGELYAISIESEAGHQNNRGFQPSQIILRYFLSPDKRQVQGAFNARTYDVRGRDSSLRGAISWKPKDANFDILAEYSLLTLARCRPEDGFRDVSTYDRLLDTYSDITSDPTSWRDHARYYGVIPPKGAISGKPDGSNEASDVGASNNGYNYEDSAVAQELSDTRTTSDAS